MRTALDIDKDVLVAVEELARRQNLSAGQVMSQMLRKVLTGQTTPYSASEDAGSGAQTVAGFRPFLAGRSIVTNAAVSRLRKAEEL